MNQIARLPQTAMETVNLHADRIRPLIRISSPALTTACRQSGMPLELAEICAGILASVFDDLAEIGKLAKSDMMRSKRLERVLAATEEPAVSALRCAMAASPTNGRACVRHWDAICEPREIGKLAWLLGMDTETAYGYGKKMHRMQK